MTTLTFGQRVDRKLHYRPFWLDLGQRALKSAAQADLAYLGAHQLHIVGFVGVPYLALIIVGVLAALTSAAQTGVLTLAQVHDTPQAWDIVLRLTKTFLATFAATALVGASPGVALVSVEHALDVAGGAVLLALLTVFPAVASRAGAPRA